MIELTQSQLERYSRHILLKEVGVEGQQRILSSKVLIIGVGGLGSVAALYLAAAGVGTLGIADGDTVDLSNLQRQIIHSTPDIGRPKVDSASAKIRAMNPDVKVQPHHERLLARTISGIIQGYDFVIDCTDNLEAKFLINDACVLEKIPFSHGGVIRFSGQTMTVVPGKSACYRCVFFEPPPKDVPVSSQVGILGAVAGMLGIIQAVEAIKFITGAGEALTDRLLTFDATAMDFRNVALHKRADCQVCGRNPTITGLYNI